MFITFEGPEGSGKSSVLNYVYEKLKEKKYKVIKTREPGGTPISEQIRNIILDKSNTALDPKAEALLYAASRRQHLVEKIWPSLKDGYIVLCDRYLDSSLAYQGGARGLGIDEILNINNFATDKTFPDLTILFDIDPKLGLKRIAQSRSAFACREAWEGDRGRGRREEAELVPVCAFFVSTVEAQGVTDWLCPPWVEAVEKLGINREEKMNSE